MLFRFPFSRIPISGVRKGVRNSPNRIGHLSTSAIVRMPAIHLKGTGLRIDYLDSHSSTKEGECSYKDVVVAIHGNTWGAGEFS